MRTNYPRHLPDFDYVGCHQYFLTFCTRNRVRAFEDARAVSLVWTQFLRAADAEAFAVVACCFMPDHAHLAVEGRKENADLKRFVSRAKQLSGFHYRAQRGAALWQRYSYEHVMRAEEPMRAVLAYILENPVRARLVATVAEYPHVRSSVFTRLELIAYVYAPV